MNTIKFFWNYLKKFEDVDTDPCKQISVMKNEKVQTEKHYHPITCKRGQKEGKPSLN